MNGMPTAQYSRAFNTDALDRPIRCSASELMARCDCSYRSRSGAPVTVPANTTRSSRPSDADNERRLSSSGPSPAITKWRLKAGRGRSEKALIARSNRS